MEQQPKGNEQPFKLPEKAVRANLLTELKLSSAKGSSSDNSIQFAMQNEWGVLAFYSNHIAVHNIEKGSLKAIWPNVSAEEHENFLFHPLSFKDRIVALDPVSNELIWLYPANLIEDARVRLSDIYFGLSVGGKTEIITFKKTFDNTILIAFRWFEEVEQIIIRELDLNGKVVNRYNWPFREKPEDLVKVRNGLLGIIENRSVLIDDKGYKAVDLFGQNELFSVSPNGKYAIAYNKKGYIFSVLEFGSGTEPIKLIYGGLHVNANPPQPEGWLFWNKAKPKIDNPSYFHDPQIIWQSDSSHAVFADKKGLGFILDPKEPRAVKLMLEPGQIFLPSRMVLPDKLLVFNDKSFGKLKLDWQFGEGIVDEEEGKPETPEKPEKTEEPKDATLKEDANEAEQENEEEGSMEDKLAMFASMFDQATPNENSQSQRTPAKSKPTPKPPKPVWLIPAIISSIIMSAILMWLISET